MPQVDRCLEQIPRTHPLAENGDVLQILPTNAPVPQTSTCDDFFAPGGYLPGVGYEGGEMAAPRLMSLRPRTVGTLRPNIMLYGEPQVNGDEIGRMIQHDTAQRPDLLIVIGTSLNIGPVKEAVRSIAKAVRRSNGLVILVNKTDVSAPSRWRQVFDFHVKNEADEWVKATVSQWIKTTPSDWDEGQKIPSGLLKRHSLLA